MAKLSEYYGIKKGYPRLRKHFGKLVAYIQLLRVFTGLAPLMAGLFGTLAPVVNITFGNVITAIYVGVTLMLSQFCGQCLNQYADVELDRLAKPYRALPSGLVTREEALGLAWLLALFSVGRAFTISTFFGLVVLTLLFFAVFYSLAPLSPRKLNPFLNTAWMAVSRGFLPVFAVLSVHGRVEDALPWAVFGFLWMMAYQPTKDIVDIEIDRKFKIKTIPNTYGVKGFLVYSGLLTVFMYIYALFNTPMLLFLIPVSAIALVGLNKTVKGMENNLSWICMYAGLAVFYLIMFLNSRF
jgi:4-hydroxybenzoate polyprenyltransferase